MREIAGGEEQIVVAGGEGLIPSFAREGEESSGSEVSTSAALGSAPGGSKLLGAAVGISRAALVISS